jgi:hypothetical protein
MASVRERIRRVVTGGPSTEDATGAPPAPGAEAGGTGESVRPLASLAAEARQAGRRVKKLDKTREDIEAKQERDELFKPEEWEELVNLYPDLRFVQTGYEGFRLTPEESKRMGVTTARCMNVLLKIDPAYIAIVLFIVNYGGMITKKEATYYGLRKRAELEARGLKPPAEVSR